jgi:hypothetical protein
MGEQGIFFVVGIGLCQAETPHPIAMGRNGVFMAGFRQCCSGQLQGLKDIETSSEGSPSGNLAPYQARGEKDFELFLQCRVA